MDTIGVPVSAFYQIGIPAPTRSYKCWLLIGHNCPPFQKIPLGKMAAICPGGHPMPIPGTGPCQWLVDMKKAKGQPVTPRLEQLHGVIHIPEPPLDQAKTRVQYGLYPGLGPSFTTSASFMLLSPENLTLINSTWIPFTGSASRDEDLSQAIVLHVLHDILSSHTYFI